MAARQVRIETDGAAVSGLWLAPRDPNACLVLAHGAGAEMRQSLGTAVFAGMLGVTLFGLVFTPVFYVLARWAAGVLQRSSGPA